MQFMMNSAVIEKCNGGFGEESGQGDICTFGEIGAETARERNQV